MSLAILIDEHLGKFDSVRKKPNTLADRLRAAAARQIFNAQPLVRGHHVAAGSLLDALLRYGTLQDYQLFAYPGNHVAISERFRPDGLYVAGKNKVAVNAIRNVPLTGVDSYQITAWFNPIPFCLNNGGIEVSHRIRRYYSSTLFPITTLMHALSGRPDTYLLYLRLLLEGPLPCDSLICTSRASLAALRKILETLEEQFRSAFGTNLRYNGRLDLIPLCVDTSALHPQEKGKPRRELGLPKDGFIMLTFGRLSAVDKVDLFPFVRMLEALVKRNKNRKLLWVVAGTETKGYTEALQRRARELDIADNLKVILNPSDDVKAQLLASSDVFMLPVDTVGESFGLAPVEAMACGVPQVVSDWDGFRDTVVHGETGFLIPTYWAQCHEDLTESSAVAGESFNYFRLGQSTAIDLGKTLEHIQYLIDNEELRAGMARRSRERALNLYSGEAVTRQYEQLWAELVEGVQACPLRPRAPSFDRLPYDHVFGQYASRVLSDDAVLYATPLAQESTAESVQSELTIFGLETPAPEKRVLADALAALRENDQRGVRFGDLVESLSGGSGFDSDRLRRRIMWLVKYGYASPREVA